MNEINYHARWREELVASSPDGTLVFELTMGKLHVYFPEENRWQNMAPAWAREKWSRYLETCQAWCQENKIPLSVTPDAYFYEEKEGTTP